MADEVKVGLFTLACVILVVVVIHLFKGPVWYAVGPAIVYTAYFVKLKVRKLRDNPYVVMGILAVVSVAMILFGVF